jgi:hypothetical protein
MDPTHLLPENYRPSERAKKGRRPARILAFPDLEVLKRWTLPLIPLLVTHRGKCCHGASRPRAVTDSRGRLQCQQGVHRHRCCWYARGQVARSSCFPSISKRRFRGGRKYGGPRRSQ